jgi:hypothetical protein
MSPLLFLEEVKCDIPATRQEHELLMKNVLETLINMRNYDDTRLKTFMKLMFLSCEFIFRNIHDDNIQLHKYRTAICIKLCEAIKTISYIPYRNALLMYLKKMDKTMYDDCFMRIFTPLI